MAKKGKKHKHKASPSKPQQPTAELPTSTFDFNNFKVQAIILTIIGLVFYANSFKNIYALDDGIVIQKNEYVQRGFSGIGTILSTDAYDSFYRQMSATQQLEGGRYRPLSIVTFAIEEGLFGDQKNDKEGLKLAPLRHTMNVVLYILSVLIMLYFLRNYIFKKNTTIAFTACLLFLIHPIHTEVVANVKSRDEILSILFIFLTFIAAFNYKKSKSIKDLALGLFYYFCALLSKEYAVTLIVLIPMLFYIIDKDSLKNSLVAVLPYTAIMLLYIYIRYTIVGLGSSGESSDILNAPFKLTTGHERIATKIEILNHYLKLLFYPDPLSSDYSYNTISYKNFGDWQVWFSILNHLTMILATAYLFAKRNIIAFAIAFYLGHLALIGNILMEIGATMGERLVYHSSVGFVIVLAIGLHWLLDNIQKTQVRNIIAIGAACIVTLWCGAKTIARNAEWKTDTTLFLADVKTVPNSVLANGNAGKAYYDLSILPENIAQKDTLLAKGIRHLSKAVALHPRYVNGYINLGVAYYSMKDYYKAKDNWEMVKRLYPQNPYLINNFKALGAMFHKEAIAIVSKPEQTKEKQLEALKLMKSAVEVAPQQLQYKCDLGGVYLMMGKEKDAIKTWEEILTTNPTYAPATAALNYQKAFVIKNKRSVTRAELLKARDYLRISTSATPTNLTYHSELASVYTALGQKQEAIKEWNAILKLNPKYTPASMAIKRLQN